MPHKHRRKQANESDFNLPPSRVARSLPVTIAPRVIAKHGKGKGKKDVKRNGPKAAKSARPNANTRSYKDGDDDTPRAFKRLMALASGKRTRSGLDDGKPRNSAPEPKLEMPKILPGENMSSFSSRVNSAIPITTADTQHIRSGKDPLGLKTWKTRKEFKMHKLYDQWREEDRKIKERREDQLEEQAERELESNMVLIPDEMEIPIAEDGSGRRKRKRRRQEDDPWEELKKKRGERRPGLHDIALAPPELSLDMSKVKKIGKSIIPYE